MTIKITNAKTVIKEYIAYIKKTETIKIKTKGNNLENAKEKIKTGDYQEIQTFNKKIIILQNSMRQSKTFIKAHKNFKGENTND